MVRERFKVPPPKQRIRRAGLSKGRCEVIDPPLALLVAHAHSLYIQHET